MPPLDEDRCYAAAASRDARFDGHFVTAVKTTGIYCRPSCPAITPRRVNVEFHPTAAAAQQRGFRACKRCLPDATPGSPEWNMRRDVVARAMRLIADGEVERSGVAGLATRLGYSARHLNRLLTDDVGAGPLAIARAQRAHTARVLIETTTMRLTDVAFAAGFGSIRQFNDTIREVYAASPSALRTAAGRRSARTVAGPPDAPGSTGASTRLRLRLPYRGPLAAVGLFDWFAARAIDGIERVERVGQGAVERRIHERVVRTPAGHAVTSTEIAGTDAPEITADVRLVDPTDLAAVVQRLRRMYDLDADPIAIDERLVCDPMLAPLIARRPGLRSPGSTDAFETAVRAVIGQQISVSAARTVADRLVTSVGEPIESSERHVGGPTFVFPTAEQLVEAPDEALAMPSARARTIRSLAGAVADGRLVLDAGADAVDTRAALLELPGIGPWTADYIVLRGLSHPDVDLSTDLIVARTAESLGLGRADVVRHAADHWAPWRSYAMHHLWAASADEPAPPTRATHAIRSTRRRTRSTS